jgi:hypothetical protein
VAAVARASAPRAARRPSRPTSSARFTPFSGPLRAYGAARRCCRGGGRVAHARERRAARAQPDGAGRGVPRAHRAPLHRRARAGIARVRSAPGRHRHWAVSVLGAAGTTRPPSRLPACGRLVGCAAAGAAAPACTDGHSDGSMHGWRERCAPPTLLPGRKRGSGAPASIRR